MEVVELPVEIRYLLLNPAAKEVERRIRDLQTHHHQNHEFQERKELGLDDDEAVVPEATGRTLAVGEVS